MQNVTLPDKAEVEAAKFFAPEPMVDMDLVMRDFAGPSLSIQELRQEVALLKAFVRALYAKHGEECPLFKEGDDGQNG